MLKPMLERLDPEKRIRIVDVEDCPYLTNEYRVRAVPTLVKVQDGDTVDRVDGRVTKEDLERFLV
jgi:thioredoxin-like negative regulator of GroEL